MGFFRFIALTGIALLAAAPAYQNDFEKADVGAAPTDVQLLDGDFTVQSADGNRALQLPGDPLKDFGFLFGPEGLATADVRARIFAASSGQRKPEFGMGANGVGGYRLWIWPSENIAELRKGDAAIASAKFAWKSAAWTHLRLRVRSAGAGKWTIQGKAWPAGTPEPDQWPLSAEQSEALPAGRASAWGTPFSGKPLLFDDLSVRPAE